MEGTKNKVTLLNEARKIVFVCGLKNASDQRQRLSIKCIICINKVFAIPLTIAAYNGFKNANVCKEKYSTF